MKITDYKIISHGSMYSDYFQGCGVCGTDFEHVMTGAGCTEKDAFDDALEMIACDDVGISSELEKEGENMSNDEPHYDSDESSDGVYFYVSIRYNAK